MLVHLQLNANHPLKCHLRLKHFPQSQFLYPHPHLRPVKQYPVQSKKNERREVQKETVFEFLAQFRFSLHLPTEFTPFC